LRRHGQGSDTLTEFFPFTAGKNHQAAVRVAGDGELAGRSGTEHVAVPRWHRQTAFGIQIQRRRTLKHGKLPLYDKKLALAAKNFTFFH
jgi:hypothetical protein